MTIRDFIQVWDDLDRMFAEVQILYGDEEEPRYEGLADEIPEALKDEELSAFQATGTAYITLLI